MKRSILNKWLSDLRSGKYEQLEGLLLSADRKKGCCLGVFLHGALGLEAKPIEEESNFLGFEYETPCGIELEAAVLPSHIADEYGFRSRQGAILDGVRTSKGWSYYDLTAMNDSGVSFAEIADLIEAEPHKFFKSIEEDEA